MEPGKTKPKSISKGAKKLIVICKDGDGKECKFELTPSKLTELAKKGKFLPKERGGIEVWEPNKEEKKIEEFKASEKKCCPLTITKFKIKPCIPTCEQEGLFKKRFIKIVIKNTGNKPIKYKLGYVSITTYGRWTGDRKNKELAVGGTREKSFAVKPMMIIIKLYNKENQIICRFELNAEKFIALFEDNKNYTEEYDETTGIACYKVRPDGEEVKLPCDENDDKRCCGISVPEVCFDIFADIFAKGILNDDPDPTKPSYSGVYSTRYRIKRDGSTWTDWMEYEEPFTFDEYGLYYLEYYSIDNLGNKELINNETIVVEDIHSPDKPSRPSGPARGKPGREYTYTTSTTDADNDQVYYLFCWGGWQHVWMAWAICS